MFSQLKADILRFESANDRYARLQQHFPEITRRALEKPRDFDPFGQTGLSPLATI